MSESKHQVLITEFSDVKKNRMTKFTVWAAGDDARALKSALMQVLGGKGTRFHLLVERESDGEVTP